MVFLSAACIAFFAGTPALEAIETEKIADNPLFVDPVYSGSTDPMVCYNPVTQSYYMYYTSRRMTVEGLGGIEAIHGTPIGMAESKDGGATWSYIGDAKIDYSPDENPTYWAPEVIFNEGVFHMYLTYVPGIFNDWSHPRDIVHLTSPDGINWTTQSVLKLAVRKVIDACVVKLPQGGWRLWYNNETDGKSIYYADSPDLYNWTDKGKVPIETRGEGPNVFFWKGKYYMIIDEWKGLSAWSSEDLLHWTKSGGSYLVDGQNGQARGNHADVEVVGDRAYMFYFSNYPLAVGPDQENASAKPASAKPETVKPETAAPGEMPRMQPVNGRRRMRMGHATFVVELQLDADGNVFCDTTKGCSIDLMSGKVISQ